MSYVEGFVAAVPRANKDAYRNHAAGAVAMFKEFGATRQVELFPLRPVGATANISRVRAE